MIETTTVELKAKKNVVRFLVEACPQGHDFLNHSCPLRNVRKLTPDNSTHYINGLSEGQLDQILEYHKGCYGLYLKL